MIAVIADGLPYDDAGVIELRLRSTNRAGTPPHSGRSALSGSEKDPTPEMLNAARREVAERHSTGSLPAARPRRGGLARPAGIEELDVPTGRAERSAR